MDAPFARSAQRIRWWAIPPSVRAAVQDRLGAAVLHAISQPGGFTHGVAERLWLTDGTIVFVKALPADDPLAGDFRAEGRCVAALPDGVPAPRLQFRLTVDGWEVLVFEDLPGRHPDLTDPADLQVVLDAWTDLAPAITPCPVQGLHTVVRAMSPVMTGWRTLVKVGPPEDVDPWVGRHLHDLARLESRWARAASGRALVHGDLRPDNLLLHRGRAFLVDWACAGRGAAWLDLIWMLGSVAGVDQQAVVRSHPLTRHVDAGAIDAVLAALAGCWEQQSRLPSVPTSVHLRPFQARNAVQTRLWLAERTGWR